MAEYVWIRREYAWVFDNRQGSEYVSNNTEREVAVQVNKCLLSYLHWKIEAYSNPVKDIRWVALKNNYNF